MQTIDFETPRVVVALDHARYFGVVPGLEAPQPVLETVIEAGAEAIMTSFGVIKRFGHVLQRIPTLMRLDGGASVYREQWLQPTEWRLLHTVEEARELGARGVCVMLFMGSEVELETMDIVARVARDSLSDGFTVMVEALPCPHAAIPDPLQPEAMAAACRLAFEHGADVVKTYYTGTPEGFRRVTRNCPAPVLIAGGVKMESKADVLEVVHGAVSAGAKGVVFGRNIWQSDDPGAMVRALRGVIHEGLSVKESLVRLAG